MLVAGLFFHAGLGSLVGVVVGAVEILQRYRDAPFRAVFNAWGVGYIVLNVAGVVRCVLGPLLLDRAAAVRRRQAHRSAATAGVVRGRRFRRRHGDPRAGLSTIRRPNGQKFGFGPAIVVETLLAVVDRQLDRSSPRERYRTVRLLMNGIDLQRASRRLPKELFLALQSVPEKEAAHITGRIEEIDRMDDLSAQGKAILQQATEAGYGPQRRRFRSLKGFLAATLRMSPRAVDHAVRKLESEGIVSAPHTEPEDGVTLQFTPTEAGQPQQSG